MKLFENRCGWWIVLGLLVVCGGCQTPSGSPRSWFPWSKPSRPRVAQTSPPSEVAPPLRPEQKADIQLTLAITDERQGRTDEAKRMYQEILKIVPDRADIYHRLALLHSRQGECQAAEPYYRRGLQLDPNDANLHCDLGYNYYLQQRWPEAEASLRQALALDSSHIRARNNLGMLLARTGREADAMREFASAGCDRAQATANLALALALQGRVEHSRHEYRRALDHNPTLKAARDGLASLDSFSVNRPVAHSGPLPPVSSATAAPASYQEPAFAR